jgi:hypothetical protein
MNEILSALQVDDRAEINISTYVKDFGPCAGRRVRDAFDSAIKAGIIEHVATNAIGGHIYRRTIEAAHMFPVR